MPRVFAYLRVSTTEQTVENQIGEITTAGFQVEQRRIIAETVSGSSIIEQRKGFMRLMDRLEEGDILVVTRMDRFGRNAIDVTSTVAKLAAQGVRVHCLQLGGADLTSAAGKMVMGMLNTFAEFERNLLIERTKAGLARAKAAGRKLGRPAAMSARQRDAIRQALVTGVSVSALARQYATSRQTILRVKAAAAAE